MTFSICVREPYEDEDGEQQTRYGVAVTTRLPSVGTLCPFANEHGAVASQSFVNVSLGRRGVGYLADGLAVEDALQSLLNADEEASASSTAWTATGSSPSPAPGAGSGSATPSGTATRSRATS
jgi:uncharacterized Ntn-hydrolase superfamily protein